MIQPHAWRVSRQSDWRVCMMRIAASLLVAVLCVAAAEAGEEEAGPEVEAAAVWTELGGWAEEQEAESLELRDELVAADLAFLSALEKAAAAAAVLKEDDPRHPLAWARVEYLAESAFRLLGDTGEYEAFLKATSDLTPEWDPPLEITAIGGVEAVADDIEGGLRYESAAGKRLLPARINGEIELIDAETAEAVAAYDGVKAFSERQAAAVGVSIPLVKLRIGWLRAQALERLGRAAEARSQALPLGLIREWLLIGPLDRDVEPFAAFDSERGGFIDTLEADFETVGQNGNARWRPVSTLDPLGGIYPEAVFPDFGPAMAYAVALVHSSENQMAVIGFGSSGPAAIWVNGNQIHRSAQTGSVQPSQEAFNVWLRRGWNLLVVKTLSGPTGWGLALWLNLPDGSPFVGQLAAVSQEDIPFFMREARQAVERSRLERFFIAAGGSELGGLNALSRRISETPDDPRANFYLGSLLAARRLMEGSERFDRELIFRRAIELSEGNPYFILTAARSAEAGIEGPDREENLRLLLLKMASERGSSAAMTDIGRLYLDVMRQPRRAGQYAQMALEANPMSLRAGVLAGDVAASRNWRAIAEATLEHLSQRHPGAKAVRLRTGRAALQRGRFRQALTEFYALLGVDAGNVEALRGAVMALGRLGQTSAAVDLLKKRLDAFPYDADARYKLVDFYRNLGRDVEALAIVETALKINPDDARALSIRDDIARERSDLQPPADAALTTHKPEDMFDYGVTNSPLTTPPPDGWEYLYFQLEDTMEHSGIINRDISFAVRVYTDQAASLLRRLDFGLETDIEQGSIERILLIRPDGRREALTPPAHDASTKDVVLNLPPLAAGTVVAVEVAVRRERIPFLGDYFGQVIPLGQTVPVRLFRYMFTAPRERKLHFLPINGAPQAMIVGTPDGRGITRIWEMNDLPGYKEEPFGPGRQALMPCVQISSFGDWDEFARWYWRLISSQYHAPPELRLLAKRVSEDSGPNPMDRLDKAASWVAENLTHREWEFGSYAFRPISVRAILSRRAADGKDRTLLLCLLAREYGLDAWPVLARSWEAWWALPGADDLTLPLLDHFNYSLTSVDQQEGGRVFLDASNPYRPPGVMPASLFGMPAVRLTPEKAEKLVIPDAGLAGCDWRETASAVVDPDGSILWEEDVYGSGAAAEALRHRFADPAKKEDIWQAFLKAEGGDVSAAAVEFSDAADTPASASFHGRARLREYATTGRDRVVLRIPPLPGRRLEAGGNFEFPLNLDYLAVYGEREQDLLLPSSFRIARRLSVTYPIEWRLTNPPQQMEERYDFGTLRTVVSHSPGSLEVEYVLEVPERRVAVGAYDAFRRLAAFASDWRRPLLVWEK